MQETCTFSLELYGDPNGYSAVVKSVGVPCGIAAQLMLDGNEALKVPAVLASYKQEICDEIRELVKKEGILVAEKIV